MSRNLFRAAALSAVLAIAPAVRAALAAALFHLSLPLAAHQYEKGALSIVHPHARATPKGATTGAGYLKILNRGEAADRLLSVSSAVAERVELHQHVREGNIMRMRPMPSGIPVPAKAKVELAPGGLHIMWIGLRRPLKDGATFDATLRFEKAGAVPVVFRVEAPSAGRAHHDH